MGGVVKNSGFFYEPNKATILKKIILNFTFLSLCCLWACQNASTYTTYTYEIKADNIHEQRHHIQQLMAEHGGKILMETKFKEGGRKRRMDMNVAFPDTLKDAFFENLLVKTATLISKSDDQKNATDSLLQNTFEIQFKMHYIK